MGFRSKIRDIFRQDRQKQGKKLSKNGRKFVGKRLQNNMKSRRKNANGRQRPLAFYAKYCDVSIGF